MIKAFTQLFTAFMVMFRCIEGVAQTALNLVNWMQEGSHIFLISERMERAKQVHKLAAALPPGALEDLLALTGGNTLEHEAPVAAEPKPTAKPKA